VNGYPILLADLFLHPFNNFLTLCISNIHRSRDQCTRRLPPFKEKDVKDDVPLSEVIDN